MGAEHALWVLIVGIVIVLAAALDSLGRRTGVPPVVGYFVLGIALRVAEARLTVLGEQGLQAFGFLADLGIVVLLFHVGLASNLGALVAQLRPAMVIWAGNVFVAGVSGFVAAYAWIGWSLPASLLAGTALTATSIGVAAAVWRNAHALDSPNGRRVLNVAQLDDISGVALMALVFALLPVLGRGDGATLATALLGAGALFVLKFAVFGAGCLLFARYVEGRLTHLVARLRHVPQRMLAVAGTGFMIAAAAGALGFSLAIGALFAGLLFSRDPEAVRTEARFNDLHAFFAPFFFIGVGLQIDPSVLGEAAGAGVALVLAAILGKLIGGALPALMVTGSAGAVLIGVSLVPRAEIAMVIAHQGRAAGALPEAGYAALVLVSAVTCLVSPWVLQMLLKRWPQPDDHAKKR